MGISFLRRDPIIGGFPIHFAEIEGNSTVRSGIDLAPHAEERGEEVAKWENLSNFLKEYESQTHKFQDHLIFS